MRDHKPYSALCCFGTADLKLIDGSANVYEIANSTCRENLITALPAVLESSEKEVEEAAVREALAEASERRRLAETHRAAAAKEAEAPVMAQVNRAIGKRPATAAVLRSV